jgi:hypothetical protein
MRVALLQSDFVEFPEEDQFMGHLDLAVDRW